MARIKRTHRVSTQVFSSMQQAARDLNENNDCAVKAVAAATGADYNRVHTLMAAHGRKSRRGTHWKAIRATLYELGFELKLWRYKYVPEGWSMDPVENRCLTALIRTYPGRHGEVLKSVTTHHPERFAKQWAFAKGRAFIVETNGGNHVAAIVDGVVHDWTKGRAARICRMHEIVKI